GEIGDDVFPTHFPRCVNVWICVYQSVKRLVLPQLLVARATSQNPLKSFQVGIRLWIGCAHYGFGYRQPTRLVGVGEYDPQAGSRIPSSNVTPSEKRKQKRFLDY